MLLTQSRAPTAIKVITMILRMFRRAKPDPLYYLGTLTKKKEIYIFALGMGVVGGLQIQSDEPANSIRR